MGFFDLFKNEVYRRKENSKNIDTGINLHLFIIIRLKRNN